VNPTETDDALRSDPQIEPSAAFRAQVMRAVHARAASGRPFDRVGRALWPVAAVGSVVVALLIAETALERSESRPGEMLEVIRWLSFTMTGTFAIACRLTRRYS
jgi:hypothetical protein